MTATKTGICAYCGISGPITDEHVIPRTLFATQATRYIVVPACLACNQRKANDDGYLRDFLAVDEACQYHPEAKVAFRDFLRSARGSHSDFAKDTLSKATLEPHYSPGGVYLDDHYAIPLNLTRLNRIFFWVSQGLYYDVHKTVLPSSVKFEGSIVERTASRSVWEDFIAKTGATVTVIGQGVFSFIHAFDPADPYVTGWLMSFYQWMPARAFVQAKRGKKKEIFVRDFVPQFDKGLSFFLETSTP